MASNVTRSSTTTNLCAKAGTVRVKTDSTGVVATFTLEGHQDLWVSIKPTLLIGSGIELLSAYKTGLPASGLYLETYEERPTIMRSAQAGGAAQPGVIEIDMVYKDVNALSAGSSGSLGSPTPVPVYEIEWVPSEIPLPGHSVRYPNLKDAASGFRSFFDFFVAYINAGNDERARLATVIQGFTASAGKNQLYDILNAWRQGIESKRVYHPVLTKTTTRNTEPNIQEIGMIETPPAGFGGLKPSGYTFVKSAHRVTRTGRVGAYNEVEQWEGAKFVPTALYGTPSEQSTVPTAP